MFRFLQLSAVCKMLTFKQDVENVTTKEKGKLNSDFFPEPNCYCQDWHGCLMSKNVVGQDNVQPSKFSKCSVDDYHQSLQQIEEASCLLRTYSKVTY